MEKNITISPGDTFGRWTVVREGKTVCRHKEFWCRCACGDHTERYVRGDKLLAGLSRSCGCLKRTHGKTKTSMYNRWRGIKERCRNPRNPFYHRYGGRGITVCDEWYESFEAFYAAVGDPPDEMRVYLDREDNDRGYEPGNMRWVDAQTSSQNRGDTISDIIKELEDADKYAPF